jgi:hypothetical protein
MLKDVIVCEFLLLADQCLLCRVVLVVYQFCFYLIKLSKDSH